MADTLFTPINKVIHDTADKILTTNLPGGVDDVLKSVIDSGASVVKTGLEKIKEFTEETPPAPPPPPGP